jgi:hypothetical protein
MSALVQPSRTHTPAVATIATPSRCHAGGSGSMERESVREYLGSAKHLNVVQWLRVCALKGATPRARTSPAAPSYRICDARRNGRRARLRFRSPESIFAGRCCTPQPDRLPRTPLEEARSLSSCPTLVGPGTALVLRAPTGDKDPVGGTTRERRRGVPRFALAR